MRKHRTSGHTVNNKHFTGKSESNTKRKHKSTRKTRKLKKRTHKNKYGNTN